MVAVVSKTKGDPLAKFRVGSFVQTDQHNYLVIPTAIRFLLTTENGEHFIFAAHSCYGIVVRLAP